MTATAPKRLGIIIPSYNDPRILKAIESVRAFDDVGAVSIILMDGGSKPELVARMAAQLTPDDILVSEPDKGIFDALNKGLEACTTEYIGWIGSDDMFSGHVPASEVIRTLETCDLFVANTAHVQGDMVTRITHSRPSRHKLARFGLNNPHFSTFGRSALLKRERFPLDLRGADIEYFLRIFNYNPNVITTDKISTYMEAGGFSNSSYKAILKTNKELYGVYRRHIPAPLAALSLLIKLGYKGILSSYFKIRKTSLKDLPAQ